MTPNIYDSEKGMRLLKDLPNIERQLPDPVVVENIKEKKPESATTQPTIKVWDAPIVDRQKLREHLNALETHGHIIFGVLNVSTAQVQIIYYKEV
jgi:hypothetical protein